MSEDFKQQALDYHQYPTPGKLEVIASKSLNSKNELALAYSPGVAFPCLDIYKNPSDAAKYTNRANLVAVISNGTAVLGLGNIGALASKPVMEGKAVLFKAFAGINVFDLEINQNDPDKLIETIASLEPTFGGINLEDIKAPECFYIETKLREKMNIPVFHDDQHGTAIIAAAGLINSLEINNKSISNIRLVVSGAGAAAISCTNLLVSLGLPKSNVIMCDSKGVIYQGRDQNLDPTKLQYAIADNGMRSVQEALVGADAFLGLSKKNLISPEDVANMAVNPVIFALANPDPEITPDLARKGNPNVIVCTGRSDYPNQINNVLCFPYIFRGALDCGATKITEEMKRACVFAIAQLAKEGPDPLNPQEACEFGRDYVIPSPFDSRLISRIATAVAKNAIDTGIATIELDLDKYSQQLKQFALDKHLAAKNS